MKVLVTGADGMLGSALCPILTEGGYEVLGTDVNISNIVTERLDISDSAGVNACIAHYRPGIVFHLAAETNVDKCELEPEHAYIVNVEGTRNIAGACGKQDIPLVYISTCGIFDGTKKEPYTELDRPNPVNVYAKTKLEAELIVNSLLKKYYIFRAGWMMGGSQKDKKFVAKIVELFNTKTEISVVDDKIGSPTYTVDLSRVMLEVVKRKRYGLYHAVNRGFCSRFTLASKIGEFLKKEKVVLKPIASSQFPLPARRPASEAAENLNLKLIGLEDMMRSWEDALQDYLEKSFQWVK